MNVAVCVINVVQVQYKAAENGNAGTRYLM